jgi:hypothetical protein
LATACCSLTEKYRVPYFMTKTIAGLVFISDLDPDLKNYGSNRKFTTLTDQQNRTA